MKRFLCLVLLLCLPAIAGCGAAQKPDTGDARTYIVPDVSKVSFDTVDPEKVPDIVRSLVKILEKQEASAWAQAEGSTYLVISPGEKNSRVEVTEVLLRIPREGFSWLEVKTVMQAKGKSDTAADQDPVVVRADVRSTLQGVGFIRTYGNEASAAPVPQARNNRAQTQAENNTITTPRQNQEITSPVQVEGAADSAGNKRLRLSTRGGEIIKEVSVPVENGRFKVELSYRTPENPAHGEIILFGLAAAGETVLARVPVVIK